MFKIEWTKKHTTILTYICGTMLLSVAVVLLLLFPGIMVTVAKGFLSAISPVIFGFAVAYLLFPICTFFERNIFLRLKFLAPHKKLIRTFSVVLTLLLAILLISLFISMVIPQIKASYLDLELKFGGYLSAAAAKLEEIFAEVSRDKEIGTFTAILDIDLVFDTLENVIDTFFGAIGNIADKVVTYSSKVLTIVANIAVSLIFAVYFMLEKEKIFSAFSRLSSFLLPYKVDRGARKWINFTHHAFGSFISGKLLNAFIITVVNFILYGLCGIPYAPLIALITGITDMIPYFGPFIGAIPAAFIILIADPIKVLWFIALVLVIQQIDGNFIGPKILGEKVGVDSLLIIVAITVSGGLWGIVGMFIGVPVFTVLYQMVKEFVENRLEKKGLPKETKEYGKKGAL
ncbi:MAG: AI-2E family transporter [Clostridia bacterium]|nr:AI-2E family transporter [Clostridia bacterium]